MPIHLLVDHYPWLAKHAGFSLLPKALELNGCSNTVTRPRSGLLARAIGKSYSTWKRFPPRDQAAAASEAEFLLRMRLSQNPGHILFLESHLQYLSSPSKSTRWIGTIHLPRRCWKSSDLELLRALPGVFVLCDYMREQFDDIFDCSQVKVLPQGVDALFFKPGDQTPESRPHRLLFVGAWLRNTAMLARLVPEIIRRFPGVIFDLVVPLHARNDEAIQLLQKHPAVRWYHNLSDEDLRARYQEATAMLLPMQDGGANNAVVEALACGLPIITTDTGGIRSYGGGTVFPIVKNDDDLSCLDLIATYLTDPEYASAISQKSRAFAETTLDWTVAAREYLGAYSSLGFI